MNTELRDPLDDQLRALMRTAVADAATAPTIADIERGAVVRLAPPTEVRHSARWVAIAAVMLLALGGGIVWSLRVENPAKPANQPNPVDDRPGLGVYLLPTTLPDGWRLVDISEMAADNAGAIPSRVWLITARDSSARAVLSISSPTTTGSVATDDVTATTAAGQATDEPKWTRNAYRGTYALSWTERDQQVWMSVRGLSEGQARALRADLQPNSGSGALTYSLPTNSSFRFEQDLGQSEMADTGYAALTFVDGDGNLGSVGLYRSSLSTFDVLLDSTIVGAPAVAQVDPSSGQVFGSRESSDVSAFFWSPSASRTTTPAAVKLLLDSLAPADEETWDDSIARVGDALESWPIVGTAPISGGSLSVHRDGDTYAVCLRVESQQGCHAGVDAVLSFNDSRLEAFSASLLIGGEWVVVQGVNEQDATGPVEVDVAGVQSEIVSTEVGSFALMIVPSGVDQITFSIGVQGQRSIADARAVRPIR